MYRWQDTLGKGFYYRPYKTLCTPLSYLFLFIKSKDRGQLSPKDVQWSGENWRL